MKRIIVIGCPGSGKSTLAGALRERTGLPLYHLDRMYWNEDRTHVSREVFLERLHRVMEKDAWILDGNYASTMELRLRACDTVIFLDYPVEVCLDGIRRRRGMPRSDMPWVETEEDEEFLSFVKSFEERQAPTVRALLEQYRDQRTIVTLKSRREAEELLLRADSFSIGEYL